MAVLDMLVEVILYLKVQEKQSWYLMITISNLIFDMYQSFKYKFAPGNYGVSEIPDPIPNSEVKAYSADGTLS